MKKIYGYCLFLPLQPGSNAKYKDMKITIGFSMTAEGDWFVDVWVS